MRSAAAGTLLAVAIAAQLWAQAPDTSPQARERFEAASIKPSPPRDGAGSFLPRSGRFAAQGQTLAQLVTYAYGVMNFQLAGGPEWTRNERFDVDATAPGNSSGHPRLVQRLLEDRFALKVRRETRDLPVLVLVKSRADGTLGPNLKPVATSCSARDDKQQPPCTMRFSPGVIRATGDWAPVAAQFSWLAGFERMVIDKTGLSGEFE